MGSLQLDLQAELNHAIRRQIEECRRRARITCEEREQELAPTRDAGLAGCEQRLPAQVIGRIRIAHVQVVLFAALEKPGKTNWSSQYRGPMPMSYRNRAQIALNLADILVMIAAASVSARSRSSRGGDHDGMKSATSGWPVVSDICCGGIDQNRPSEVRRWANSR